ncbi:MerR family transcriptional regulator [Mycobacteroides saopaulense]|uniref:MerR family transcriptional regulator n=1 Tax=Mycobacteroides saopaulense TaxID=1578165 RepID=UPI002351E097|nr:MerR family transcriptional regulator [Mycobacteroides saopaulense]
MNAHARGQALVTVGRVSEMTGLSVRALHHYDEIGLVVPSARTTAGYRGYSDTDIERLHMVLLYRELGFGLEQIAALLDDPAIDMYAHLESQRALLLERIDRLHRMVVAVANMMSARKSGIRLSVEEQIEIFGDSRYGDEYATEAQQRWGDTEAWKQSQERVARYSKEDWARIKAEVDQLLADLAAAKRADVRPGSERANALARAHRRSIESYYDCTPQLQVCLTQMYLTDDRFRAYYDSAEPGLAQWLHDAVAAYAKTQQ